jgi:hypothetical protein
MRTVVAASILLLLASGARAWWQPGGDAAPPAPASDKPSEVLRRQTFRQTLELAAKDQSYYLSGYISGSTSKQANLEWMFSNRRCLRILSEIEQARPDRRQAMIQEVFDYVLATHKQAVLEDLAVGESGKRPATPGVPINATPWGLCMALVASAEFGASPEFLKHFEAAHAFQSSIEERLTETRFAFDFTPGYTRMFGFVDERAWLNILALQARRTKVKLPEPVARRLAECRTSKVFLAHWTAETIFIEGEPPAGARGLKTIELLDWPPGPGQDKAFQQQLVKDLFEAIKGHKQL